MSPVESRAYHPGLFVALGLRLVDGLGTMLFACAAVLARLLPLSGKVRLFFADRSAAAWQLTCAAAARLESRQGGSVYWFHVASAGELEQAIPYARSLAESGPCAFVVSFLSPSARPFVANFPNQESLVSFALHPFARRRVRELLRRVKPQVVFFVRYDLWPALVLESNQAKVPLVLLAGTRRLVSQGVFAAPAAAMKFALLRCFERVLALSELDAAFFARAVGPGRVTVAGDPKWARAKERASRSIVPDSPVGALSRDVARTKFATGCHHVLVFGSPHKEEWRVAGDLVAAAVSEGWPLALVLAPHDVGVHEVNRVRAFVSACAPAGGATMSVRLLSSLVASEPPQLGGGRGTAPPPLHSQAADLDEDEGAMRVCSHERGPLLGRHVMGRHELSGETPIVTVWIIDLMGHLAEIYGLADVAVVGGGFDGQLHNCLEPSARGVPVILGPRHERAPEAATLLGAGAAKTLETSAAMFQFLLQCVRVSRPVDRSSSEPGGHDAVLARMALRANELFESLPQTNEIMRASVGSLVRMLDKKASDELSR